jgi:hypothetical protein
LQHERAGYPGHGSENKTTCLAAQIQRAALAFVFNEKEAIAHRKKTDCWKNNHRIHLSNCFGGNNALDDEQA